MPGLARYMYLDRRRLAALLAMVTAASMLASMTGMMVLGVYRGVEAFAAPSRGVALVYDTSSRTPFTGLLPLTLASRLAGAEGVEAVSPEVLAPCLVEGEPVFLRGVVPENFTKTVELRILEGRGLGGDPFEAMVGAEVAGRLGLGVGDRILAVGVLKPVYVELRVVGIYEAGTPLDDEILVGLETAQWLRTSSYSQATLIRVKGQAKLPETTAGAGREEGGPGAVDLVAVASRLARYLETLGERAGRAGAATPEGFAENYVEELGMGRETLYLLTLVVLLFSAAGIVVAVDTVVVLHREEVGVLRTLGASKRTVKADLALKLAPWVVAASLLGVLLAVLVLETASQGLLLLSHRVLPALDPWLVAATILAVLGVVAWALARTRLPGGGET